MNEPKVYTAADIERYHRGEMTPAEMHRLEAAALDYPMLADALEGYLHTATASSDLLFLQEKLRQRMGEQEKKGAAIFRLPWLRIAALFLIVAGGGWLIFKSASNKGNDLANSSSRKESAPVQAIDSTSTVMQIPPAALSVDSNTLNKDVATTRTSVPLRNQTGPATTPSHLAKGKTGSAAGTATIRKAEENEQEAEAATLTSTQPAAAPAVRAANDTVKRDVAMKKEDAQLNEVVVSGAKAERRRATLQVDTASPVDGWPAFDAYLTKNRKTPAEWKTKASANGDVELTFEVDSNGNPVTIKVKNSLCAACDAEAIRLLKEGPKWKGKKGMIKISFSPPD
jgi:hypothetical protein